MSPHFSKNFHFSQLALSIQFSLLLFLNDDWGREIWVECNKDPGHLWGFPPWPCCLQDCSHEGSPNPRHSRAATSLVTPPPFMECLFSLKEFFFFEVLKDICLCPWPSCHPHPALQTQVWVTKAKNYFLGICFPCFLLCYVHSP